MEGGEDWRNRIVAVASILVLGLGFVAMFLEISWFWMIWILGYAVFVPLLAITLNVDDEDEGTETVARDAGQETDTGSDALETLRDRYARGELTDEQFERKLERLLETETIEDLEDARRGLDGPDAPAVEREGRPGGDAESERER